MDVRRAMGEPACDAGADWRPVPLANSKCSAFDGTSLAVEVSSEASRLR